MTFSMYSPKRIKQVATIKSIVLWIVTLASLTNFILLGLSLEYREAVLQQSYWSSLIIGGVVSLYTIFKAIRRKKFIFM